MNLENAFKVRHNAIAFLRHAFAIIVILGHAWEVGGFGRDPLERFAGVTLGQIGVHAFFVIGGFLVTGSFLNAPSWRTYIVNRALRILPGFWACLFVTAALIAPLAAWYLIPPGSPAIHGVGAYASYIAHNFLLRIRQPNIDSLFIANPAAGVINGSLWSIFPEAVCYALLAIAGVFGMLRGSRRALLVAVFAVGAGLFAAHGRILASLAGTPWEPKAWYLLQLAGLGACFAGGAVCWTFREMIPWSRRIQLGSLLLAALVISCGAYQFAGPLVLGPAIISLATLLPWTAFDRWGDYSYGLYLYHYPIQQLLYAAPVPISNPLLFFAASLLLTAPIAALSWLLVEKRALRLKPQTLHRNDGEAHRDEPPRATAVIAPGTPPRG